MRRDCGAFDLPPHARREITHFRLNHFPFDADHFVSEPRAIGKSRRAARPSRGSVELRGRFGENRFDMLAGCEQQHVREHVELPHDSNFAEIST